MTEPVASAASPRRTVRVAVALVAGQAALCAVIGWVTFGSPDAPPAATTRVAPLAEPPPAATPGADKPQPSAVAPATTRSSDPRQTAEVTRPPAPPPKPKAKATVTTTPPPTQAAASEEAPTTVATTEPTTPADMPPPMPNPTPTAEPTPTDVQQDVVAGDPCEPPGAAGLTADDVAVKCRPGLDGAASWQIN